MVALAASLLFGCLFLTHGIGPRPAAAEIVSTDNSLDLYFEHLCRQAGLAAPAGCRLPVLGDGNWTLLVRQGLNDIDRRCEAYLQWLDHGGRTNTAVSSESGVAPVSNQSMAEIAGGSAASLSNLGLAFSLLSQRLEDNASRLPSELESFTLYSIVRRSQHEFRHQFKDRIFSNRPDAEYVLRSYAGLCLPKGIKTSLNVYAILGARSALSAGDDIIHEAPETGPTNGANLSITRPERPRPGIIWAVSEAEKRSDIHTAKTIQRALCVFNDGVFGRKTRAAIREFQSKIYSAVGDPRMTGSLTLSELSNLRDAGECAPQFGNYTERFALASPQAVAALGKILKKDYPELKDDASLADLRDSIARKRVELGLSPGPRGMFARQATYEFLKMIKFYE